MFTCLHVDSDLYLDSDAPWNHSWKRETFYRVQCHIKASVTHKKRHFKQFGDKKNLIVFFLEKEYVMCYVMLSVLCFKIYKTITTILLLLLLVVVVVVLLLFILLITTRIELRLLF